MSSVTVYNSKVQHVELFDRQWYEWMFESIQPALMNSITSARWQDLKFTVPSMITITDYFARLYL